MYRNFTPPRPDRQAWKIKTGKGKIMLAFSKRVCYHIPAREVHVHAPVAQLDRVTDYESVGRGFESLLAYQKHREIVWFPGVFLAFLHVLKRHVANLLLTEFYSPLLRSPRLAGEDKALWFSYISGWKQPVAVSSLLVPMYLSTAGVVRERIHQNVNIRILQPFPRLAQHDSACFCRT